LPRDLVEGFEELMDRPADGDVRRDASRIERDAARANNQRVVVQFQGAKDDLRRADELADTDHRRIAQRGRRRHLETLECRLPRRTRDGVGAEREEIVGEEYGGRFAEPEDAPFAFDVLEGHDENSARQVRLGADTRVRPDDLRHLSHRYRGRPVCLSHRCRGRPMCRPRESDGDDERADHGCSASRVCPFSSATFSTHVGSPVPRQATTSVRACMLNSVSRRVNAAA
jgi:hypothetical protein